MMKMFDSHRLAKQLVLFGENMKHFCSWKLFCVTRERNKIIEEMMIKEKTVDDCLMDDYDVDDNAQWKV